MLAAARQAVAGVSTFSESKRTMFERENLFGFTFFAFRTLSKQDSSILLSNTPTATLTWQRKKPRAKQAAENSAGLRRAGGLEPQSPTQAKTRLEWATQAYLAGAESGVIPLLPRYRESGRAERRTSGALVSA
jgi:hypothetical protein